MYYILKLDLISTIPITAKYFHEDKSEVDSKST